jgi:hypothetical protein
MACQLIGLDRYSGIRPQAMNVQQLLNELRAECRLLDRLIASLERMPRKIGPAPVVPYRTTKSGPTELLLG